MSPPSSDESPETKIARLEEQFYALRTDVDRLGKKMDRNATVSAEDREKLRTDVKEMLSARYVSRKELEPSIRFHQGFIRFKRLIVKSLVVALVTAFVAAAIAYFVSQGGDKK